ERVKEKNKDVVAKHDVSPYVSEEPMVKEKQSSLVDTSIPIVKNTNLRSVPNRKALNFHTLYTPRGNEVDVVVLVESIRVISESLRILLMVSFLESEWLTLLLLTMLGTLGVNMAWLNQCLTHLLDYYLFNLALWMV
ncbi:hypothetical protein Tco_0229661, partial [Tanacetum coccineum]